MKSRGFVYFCYFVLGFATCYLGLAFHLFPEKPRESPLFELDGKAYAMADLPIPLKEQLQGALNQGKHIRSLALKQIGIRLMALAPHERNAQALPPALEVALNVEPVSDDAAQKYFQDNRRSYPQNVTLDQIKRPLKEFLSAQQNAEIMEKKWGQYLQQGRVRLHD